MQELIDVFGIDLKLLIAQGVNFGLALLVLWYFLYRPVMSMLERRRALIQKGVEDAQRAEKELAEAGQKRSELIQRAGAEADRLLGEARERAAQKEKELTALAEEKGTRILAESRERAEEERRRALLASREELARLAVLGAEKILREKI